MKLKKLIVHGFKSFKDKTTIHFDDGITGIVGPNGCGKSNIVDALFWIMGEQSAKHLRGSSMKDVIFSGSSKYAPANFAEASLVLENTNGKHIHIGNKVVSPSEIQLSRKLYRDGESEYRINGSPCRLKDIQEVFMDTGAGAKSYSIIAQGEINRLVQSKPEERRIIVEEVAGITKFKMRRRESLRKMEQTESNLNRLNDLKVEIERNLGSLRKQAEKAERARNLKEKIRKDELNVNAHKVHDHLKNYRDFKTFINENVINLENWKTEKDGIEVSLEQERNLKDLQVKKIDQVQLEYNELSRELAQKEERLNYLCEGQSEKENLLEEKRNEQVEITEEKENRLNRLDGIKEQKTELEKSNEEKIDFTALEEEVDRFKNALQRSKEEFLQTGEKLETFQQELSEKQNEQYRLTNQTSDLAGQLEDITKEIETLEEQYSSVSGEIAREREELKIVEESSETLKSEQQKHSSILEEHQLKEAELDQKCREKDRELIEVSSHHASLEKIRESMDGISEGTVSFLEGENKNHFELLGNLIRCEEKYSAAANSIIGNYLETLVPNGDYQSAVNWWKENSEQRLEILGKTSKNMKTNPEVIERLKLNGAKDVVEFKNVLKLPENLKGELDSLWESVFIVECETVDEFLAIPDDLGHQAIISHDGKVAKIFDHGPMKLILGANCQTEVSSVERNNQIEKLSLEKNQLTEELNNLKLELEETRKVTGDLSQRSEELVVESRNAREKAISLRAKFDAKISNYEANRSRLEILSSRKEKVSARRLECLENEERVLLEIEKCEAQLNESQEIHENKKNEVADSEKIFHERRDYYLEQESKRKTFQSQLSSLDEQIHDVQGQIERLAGRLTATEQSIAQFELDLEKNETEIEALEKSNLEKAKVLEDKTDELSAVRDELEKLLSQMKEREDKVKKLSKSINQTEKEIISKETKLDQILIDEAQITQDIFERYQVDLRKTISRFLEMDDNLVSDLSDLTQMYTMDSENGPMEIEQVSYEFVRRFGQDLKDLQTRLRNNKSQYNSLGEINWQAIEDYDRQKLRFDFLVEQEQELRASLGDLNQAIDQIDTKSKQRFKVAFEEINNKFTQVFPIIFGGGEARLELRGNFEDPDAGVDIIAKPPGKKMQNINLMSGGEKALTAVSLIFSVFLVKPSPFCLLDEVDAPLDDANVGRFSELLREMSKDSQFILITHNKKTMELNDLLYGVTMEEPGISKALSVQLQ